jgi:hypothetical protein
LWRKINGFPPNFYQTKKSEKPKKWNNSFS